MIFFKNPKFLSITARKNGLQRANQRFITNQSRQNQSLSNIASKYEGPKEQALRLKSITNLHDLQQKQIKNKDLRQPLNINPSTPLTNNIMINKLVKDASKFNKKLESGKEQLQYAEEAWKRKQSYHPSLKNKQFENEETKSSVTNHYGMANVSKSDLPIPPYNNQTTKDVTKSQFSPSELQNLVNLANNGNGKEKEQAIALLKNIIKSNESENTQPKLISPMAKISNTAEITKSIEADKQLAAEIKPIPGELFNKIVKRLITEVYDEKGFEYQKFIDTIYNISSAHKTNPALIPVLNKALGRINRMSMIKLPEEKMNSFINIVLEELYPKEK